MKREVAIRVNQLGKAYHITRAQTSSRYRTLQEEIVAVPRRLLTRGGRVSERETIWALKDATFEIAHGEVVGIIGSNGAGKSTLLKILSRITQPTCGSADVYGRVGSLLEVGTGFHPELTGRENVLLSGAILGMSRHETRRYFDDIVSFAEVEAFVDTAVKRYSSGMYMRLAFAVAAYLRCEILLVDEVLAVGDARFQKRCVEKIQEVGHNGRSVLFVSHNMNAITRLCPRAVLLQDGKVLQDGPSARVVNSYLSTGLGTTAYRDWPDLEQAPGNEIVRLCSVQVRAEEGNVSDTMDIRRPIGIEMEYAVRVPGHVLYPNIHLFNEDGVCIFVSGDAQSSCARSPRCPGRFLSTAWIPGNYLAEGRVVVGTAVSTINPVTVHFFEREAVAFQVVDTLDGDSARGEYGGPIPGVVRPLLRWNTICLLGDRAVQP